MTLRSCNSKIGPATESFIPVNAFIEERVRIMSAKRVRLMEALTLAMCIFRSNEKSTVSFIFSFLHSKLLGVLLQGGYLCINLGMPSGL